MPKQHGSVDTIREIRVAPQPSGLRVVYLVETSSTQEAREIAKLFSELETHVQVRQLSSGKLMSYVVQALESDSSLLDAIEDVLKKVSAFMVTQRSFDELIYRIVKELCQDTSSKLLPVSRCNICGKIEPFPNTVVSLSDEDGSVMMSRCYCASCTAQSSAPSNKEFVRSLLTADKRNFGTLERAELVRRPSKEQPIRFKISQTPSAQS